ncbi:hypothetical protein BDB01DRAFT_465087 [Pilobolus umbonatus]|nr:hypothetical protein BDB01DRAFT_465087 [Pilobolus umbonatus]
MLLTDISLFSIDCSYLLESIYCGGVYDETFGVSSDTIALYVHNRTKPDRSLHFGWERIPTNDNNRLADREIAQSIASPNRTQMFIQGGIRAQGGVLTNPFLMFDATNNQWSSLPDFRPNGLTRGQIYYASVTYVSSIDKLVFYGGLTQVPENISTTADGVTYSSIMNENGPYMPFGFLHITTFDMNTQQWHEISEEPGPDKSLFYTAMDSFSVPRTNSIYFIGGFLRYRNNPSIAFANPYDTILEFTLSNNLWITHAIKESTSDRTPLLPAPREYHTTTLMSDNKTVLLYGGVNLEYKVFPIDEVCYLLDLDTKKWRKCPLDAFPVGIDASRESHTAVLVKDNLFILFGKVSEKYLNNIIVLDVSDLDYIHYVPEYTYQAPPEVGEEVIVNQESKDNGLSTGAIIVLITGGVLYNRRKRTVRKAESVNEFPADWDQIDHQLNTNNKPHANTVINETVKPSTMPGVVRPSEMNALTSDKPNF